MADAPHLARPTEPRLTAKLATLRCALKCTKTAEASLKTELSVYRKRLRDLKAQRAARDAITAMSADLAVLAVSAKANEVVRLDRLIEVALMSLVPESGYRCPQDIVQRRAG